MTTDTDSWAIISVDRLGRGFYRDANYFREIEIRNDYSLQGICQCYMTVIVEDWNALNSNVRTALISIATGYECLIWELKSRQAVKPCEQSGTWRRPHTPGRPVDHVSGKHSARTGTSGASNPTHVTADNYMTQAMSHKNREYAYQIETELGQRFERHGDAYIKITNAQPNEHERSESANGEGASTPQSTAQREMTTCAVCWGAVFTDDLERHLEDWHYGG